MDAGETVEEFADDSADDSADADDVLPAPERAFLLQAADSGGRLDKVVAALLPDVSRTRLRRWIDAGGVLRNGHPARASETVCEGDRILVVAAEEDPAPGLLPEPMDLRIVHEDASIIVLDKPAGLVVHPGAGNPRGTLLNGLLAHDPALARLPRAGIVHRIDAGTTGLLVVARTAAAQLDLARQLLAREVVREYWAIAAGDCGVSGTIDAGLVRDPRNRVRFRTSQSARARLARTHFRRIALLDAGGLPVSWVSCRLETGRTHQIRVHFESIGHPLLGDPVYRRHQPAPRPGLPILERQALHACRLALRHPQTGEILSWFCPPPADFEAALRDLGVSAARIARAPQPFADHPPRQRVDDPQ